MQLASRKKDCLIIKYGETGANEIASSIPVFGMRVHNPLEWSIYDIVFTEKKYNILSIDQYICQLNSLVYLG